MPGGDYTRRRVIYQDKSSTTNFAATDGNITLTAGRANYTQFIQRIVVMVKTSAAQTITFQSDSTSVYVAKMPSAPGVDTRWDFDFGPEGKSLPTGEGMQMAMTAGNAGHVEVIGYQKPDNAVAVAST